MSDYRYEDLSPRERRVARVLARQYGQSAMTWSVAKDVITSLHCAGYLAEVQAPSSHPGVLASTGGQATPVEAVEPGQVSPSPVPAPAEPNNEGNQT